METIKQSVGIDISMKKFDCCLGYKKLNNEFVVKDHKIFTNDLNGFTKFLKWVECHVEQKVQIGIVMEATGVYYENLAYHLNENSAYAVSVILPAKAKYFFKSLSPKTKTDKVDAKMLCQFGLERNLNIWKPVSCKFREMKNLSREYRDNKKLINQLKNQLHAKNHSYKPNKSLLKRLNNKIDLIEIQCLEIEVELKKLSLEDEQLVSKLDKICSIPGIGFITAISIVSETNGFALIKNMKQLSSYAGLDIQQKQSGTREGKSKISKKGNKYIRAAIYMPSLAASRFNKDMKDFYGRINSKNKCKKVGLIGVSRKLLGLMYTLWKKDEFIKVNPI